MMGMNTLARRKHNFRDRRKGNVIIRPDTKRSSTKITRPVINILDTDCFPKEGWSTCGAHLWRTVSTPKRRSADQSTDRISFPLISPRWNVGRTISRRFRSVLVLLSSRSLVKDSRFWSLEYNSLVSVNFRSSNENRGIFLRFPTVLLLIPCTNKRSLHTIYFYTRGKYQILVAIYSNGAAHRNTFE